MSGKHIDALDGIRGMAVLMVVFFHTGGGAKSTQPIIHFIGMVNKYGWTGVTLFFVLSGFLITGILWDTRDDPHHLRNFYARRSLRIFPLYYFALVLVIAGAIPNGILTECLHQIWRYVLYFQNVNLPALGLHQQYPPSKMVTIHFWSLAVEEQFYLLWPALIFRVRNIRQAQMLCVFVFVSSTAAKAVYAFAATAPITRSESLWANAGSLAVGGFIALANRRPINLSRWAPYVLVLSLIAFIAGSMGSNRIHTLSDLTTISLFWGALMVLTLNPGPLQSIFETKWLRWIGGISYGIYIYHWLFRGFYDDLAWRIYPNAKDSAHQGLRFLLTLALTILISWVSFTYFEKPISNLKRYFSFAYEND